MLVRTLTVPTDVPIVDVTKERSLLGGVAAVRTTLPQSLIDLYWFRGPPAANFPYLITPYEAIQNYVNSKSPDTVIQAVFSDFNYGAVNKTARYADACLVFTNADSGEGWGHHSD